MKSTALACLLLAATMPIWAGGSVSDYAGQQGREIKALSAQEIDGLLAGRGMGFGKSAELNRYPGPAHVLELATPLALTDEQLAASQAIHARMLERAQQAGARLVEAEAALEQRFQVGSIDAQSLREALERIGQLHAEVRGAHLLAHVEQHAVLTPEQIERYVHLRGYAQGRSHDRH